MQRDPVCFADGASLLRPPRQHGRPRVCRTPRMSGTSWRPRASQTPPSSTAPPEPVQDRLLRLERALATAVTQERYSDAARLRDALTAARSADPLLSLRDSLEEAVKQQDFTAAAQLRDDLADLTEQLARAPAGFRRRVDRLLLLRGRANPANALSVATVSPNGAVPLGLVPASSSGGPPRVFLQPTWSPTADYVAFTEVSFRIENVQGMRAISISDSECRIVVMNAFDGSVVKAITVRKPPFFYSWSPCGKTLCFLANDPDSSTPKVALSAIHVVAPAGGASSDLDAVHGPLASAHPLLYDFCPRDSTRVVAHLGNINTVCVVPVVSPTTTSRNLSCKAGTFGTPQWHPLAGEDGREVVLFVEAVSLVDEKNANPVGVKGMRSIFSSVQGEVVDEVGDNDKKNSPIDQIIGSGGSMLEKFLRESAKKLGFKDPDKTKDDAKKKEEESQDRRRALEEKLAELEEKLEGEYGQKIAGGLRNLLPDQKSDGWIEKSDSPPAKKALNELVMCDANDPNLKRVLTRFSGVMAFKLSPDGQKLVTMITDPDTGHDELTLITGDFSPDSVVSEEQKTAPRWGRERRGTDSRSADIILSTPNTRVLAFFWSPDSRKLLFLSSIRGSRVGAAQWATFDTVLNKVVRYEKFVLSGIYIHCLNFFDQFADAMTPWNPESDAFCYPGRQLTASEKERDESAPTPSAPSSPLLATLLLHRESSGDSKGFSAWVQRVPEDPKRMTPSEAESVVDNVEFATWSPC